MTLISNSISETRDCRHILHIKTLRIDCLLLPPLSVRHCSPREPTKITRICTIQYVGVSLRACKSGTIRGLRGRRAGRRVKALISVPSRPDRDGWHLCTRTQRTIHTIPSQRPTCLSMRLFHGRLRSNIAVMCKRARIPWE